MTMNPEELHFIWDPKAVDWKNERTSEKNKSNKPLSFDAYFDFIEQFDLSKVKNDSDQHVDKKFSLF